MKLLLSPLYHRQRFCRHCARAFYRDRPKDWIWQYELERMPPLGEFDAARGFVPDYSVLLMFDEFTIDGGAYERILSGSQSWLGAWPEVLRVLDAEGVLTKIDIDAEVRESGHVRAAMLRKDMRDPSRWADAMVYHDALIGAADRAFGSKPTDANSLSWSFDYDNVPRFRGSDGQTHTLSAGPLFYTGEDPTDAHYQLRDLAYQELRDQLREVNSALAVAAKLKLAPMLWAPYRRYVEEKFEIGHPVRESDDRADAARLFFQVAFPRYRPDTVKQLTRLRSDKRLQELRTVIAKSAQSGDVLDPQYPQVVLEQAFATERRIGRWRKITGWISTAVGAIPIPGLGLAAAAAGELASKAIETRLQKPWNWFYLISDGRGHS